ncbi:SDR family NAD(P)-dependent oxidoreductase [Nocardia sp. NPDC050713]|uniref:SDR family NAD(P)-dependent oxidoreductase n=1 Tax=Nocardia sp. NPDC050713 TaxID=3154511 RepID=UPI0033C8E9A1
MNVTGLMNAIGAFLPQLIAAAADKGVADLVNTSSIAAQNLFPTFAVYSGTKAYVTHLSRTLHARSCRPPASVSESSARAGSPTSRNRAAVTGVPLVSRDASSSAKTLAGSQFQVFLGGSAELLRVEAVWWTGPFRSWRACGAAEERA